MQAILSKCVWLEAVSLEPSARVPNVHNMNEAYHPCMLSEGSIHSSSCSFPSFFHVVGFGKVTLSAFVSILKSLLKVLFSPLTSGETVLGGLHQCCSQPSTVSPEVRGETTFLCLADYRLINICKRYLD